MLKIPDDVSGTLFNVLDKVCVTFGAQRELVKLTDQNLLFLF